MTRYGVIDLGSNTFHLLIVEYLGNNSFETIFRESVFTSLSDGGIDIIKQERIDFGIETLHRFKEILLSHKCSHIRVIGTAALRTAKNRAIFIDKAEMVLGSKIEVIDGPKEAHYIFKGITLLPEMLSGSHLIMDIGGGSTECILLVNGKNIFSKSYPIGVGALHEKFHNHEPITSNEIEQIKQFILHQISDLIPFIQAYSPQYLTGAAGSFEILELMSGKELTLKSVSHVDIATFTHLYDKIISADIEQRKNMPGLPIERIKLIVVGMIWKKILFDLVNPSQILVCPYALKEGILIEMIEESSNTNA